MADVKRPKGGPAPARPTGGDAPGAEAPSRLGPAPVPARLLQSRLTHSRVPVAFDAPTAGGDEGEREASELALLGEGRLGDPSVDGPTLRRMGSLVAGRHLMTLLARRRREAARAEVIREVADLLLDMDDAPWTRRLLLQMAEAGRIVDVYPLEVMAYLLEHHPGSVARVEMGDVILNKARLEAETHAVGGLIVLKVPLAMRLKAFAIEGGDAPGYVLAPGPPAHYLFEVHGPGALTLLVRGEVRKESLVDRVRLVVEETPESDRGW